MNLKGNFMSQKIRLRLKSYDSRLLDKSVKDITETVKKTGAKIKGPVPLPTKISRYTVLRSTFVNKKSREQFEIRIHKRLMDILDASEQTVDALMRIDLPAGVDIEVKL